MLEIDLDIDRLGKAVEEDFEVAAVGRRLTLRDLDPGAQDASDFGVVSAFLCPLDLLPLVIDRNAPPLLVATVGFTLFGPHQCDAKSGANEQHPTSDFRPTSASKAWIGGAGALQNCATEGVSAACSLGGTDAVWGKGSPGAQRPSMEFADH